MLSILMVIKKILSDVVLAHDLLQLLPKDQFADALARAVSDVGGRYNGEAENVEPLLLAIIKHHLVQEGVPATWGWSVSDIPDPWVQTAKNAGFYWKSATEWEAKVREIILAFLQVLSQRMLSVTQLQGPYLASLITSTRQSNRSESQLAPLNVLTLPMPQFRLSEPRHRLWEVGIRAALDGRREDAVRALHALERRRGGNDESSDRGAIETLRGAIFWLDADFKEARTAIRTAIRRSPDEKSLRLWEYRLDYNMGATIDELLKPIEAELGRDPTWKELKAWAAGLYFAAGNDETALALIASSDSPGGIAYHKLHTAVSIRRNQLHEAARHAFQVLILDPQDPEAHFNFAQVLLHRALHGHQTAEKLWQRWSLRLASLHYGRADEGLSSPRDENLRLRALVGRAVCLRELGQPEEAIGLLQPFTVNKPIEVPWVWSEWAVTLMRVGRWQDAVTAWEKAIPSLTDPDDLRGARIKLALCLLNSQDYQQAAESIRRVDAETLQGDERFLYDIIEFFQKTNTVVDSTTLAPDFAVLATRYPKETAEIAGEVYMRINQWQLARAAFQKYLSNHPQHLRSRIGLAYAHALIGHYQEALTECQDVIEQVPPRSAEKAMVLRVGIGSAEQVGDFVTVVRWTTLLEEHGETEPMLWRSRGLARMRLQDWDGAVADFEVYLSRTNDYAMLQPLVGALCGQGRYAEALQWVHRGAQAQEYQAVAMRIQAEIYVYQGRVDEGIALLERLITRYSEDQDLRKLYDVLMNPPDLPPASTAPYFTPDIPLHRRAGMLNGSLPAVVALYTGRAFDVGVVGVQLAARKPGNDVPRDLVVDPVAIMLLHLIGLDRVLADQGFHLYLPRTFLPELHRSMVQEGRYKDLGRFLTWYLEWNDTMIVSEPVLGPTPRIGEPITNAAFALAILHPTMPYLVAEQPVANEAISAGLAVISLNTLLEYARDSRWLDSHDVDLLHLKLFELGCSNVLLSPDVVVTAAQRAQWDKSDRLFDRILRLPEVAENSLATWSAYGIWAGRLLCTAPDRESGRIICRQLIVSSMTKMRSERELRSFLKPFFQQMVDRDEDLMVTLRITANGIPNVGNAVGAINSEWESTH